MSIFPKQVDFEECTRTYQLRWIKRRKFPRFLVFHFLPLLHKYISLVTIEGGERIRGRGQQGGGVGRTVRWTDGVEEERTTREKERLKGLYHENEVNCKRYKSTEPN
jgi:hypothetical protein